MECKSERKIKYILSVFVHLLSYTVHTCIPSPNSNCSKPLQAVSNRAIYLPGQRKWSLALIFNHSPAAVCKVIREVVTNSPTELPLSCWDSLSKITALDQGGKKRSIQLLCMALCVMEMQREVWTETHRTEKGAEDTEDCDSQGL